MEMLNKLLEENELFCVCFSDMDCLKYVNDTFGHAEGDRYIISVVEALQKFENSILCRLGGDEFMVLARGCNYVETENQIDAIRTELMERSVISGLEYMRSISYGIVEVRPDDSRSSSELLSLADERMYQYKRAHKKQRKD